MTSGDDANPVTQVVVYAARRLIRQAISSWLDRQDGISIAGTAMSIEAATELCGRQSIDVILVALTHDRQRILEDARALAARHRTVRFIAITNDAYEEIDQALASQFHAVVNASAGASHLLRVIRSGTAPQLIAPTVEITNTGPLTPREAEVLSLVGQGNTADDISDQLGISTSTIANHKERIYHKLDVNNQAHAVAVAVATGIISPGDTTKPEEIDLVSSNDD